MKLQQLRYLVAVAEEGSLLKASRRIGVAQPALTQQLKALEDSLETKLLHRSSRGTRTTQSGSVMVDHARTILEQVSLARRDVQEQRDTVTGELSIMIASAVAEMILPRFLKQMSVEYPHVSLRVSAQDSGTVQSALEDSRVDLGVLPEHDNLKGINSRHLLTEPMVLVTSADADAGMPSEPISFGKAARMPLIVVERNNPLRLELERLASKHRVSLNVASESNSLLMIRSYVESGAANCILPHCSVAEKARLGAVRTRPIVKPKIFQRYLVAWPKSRPLVRAAEIAVQLLQREFRNDEADLPARQT